MLGFEEVICSRAVIVCDWPACTNRINAQPGLPSGQRERADLRMLRNLAAEWGWRTSKDDSVTCPYHNRKETK